MIIKGEHVIAFRSNGRRSNGAKTTVYPIMEIQCDKCGKVFIEKGKIFKKRILMINKEWCGKCARLLMSGLAGLKSTYDENGKLKPNAGRFTTERVQALNVDEYKAYCIQRKRASNILHERLNNNEELRTAHYKKVFQNSRIGYISKGQKEVFDIVKDNGFLLEHVVDGFKCDIVNVEKKIVIEYYGDFWHANPRKFKPDDWIKLIGMSAKDKWEKDRKRNLGLRSLGYNIIIVWESEWMNDRTRVLEKFKAFMSNDWIFPEQKKKETKRKWMTNLTCNKWTTVLNEDVGKFLINGWILGKHRLQDNLNEVDKN